MLLLCRSTSWLAPAGRGATSAPSKHAITTTARRGTSTTSSSGTVDDPRHPTCRNAKRMLVSVDSRSRGSSDRAQGPDHPDGVPERGGNPAGIHQRPDLSEDRVAEPHRAVRHDPGRDLPPRPVVERL